MKRLSVFLVVFVVGVTLASVLARSILVGQHLRRGAEEIARREAMGDVSAISNWAANHWSDPAGVVRSGLQLMVRIRDGRVWLIGTDDVVRIDTGSNPSWEGVRVPASDFPSPAGSTPTVVPNRSPGLENASAFVARVVANGQALGRVVLFEPDASAPLADDILRAFLWSALLALGIAAVGGLWLNSVVLTPIAALRAFAARLGQGRFGERIQVHSFTELDELAGTLNAVSGQLESLFERTAHDHRQRATIMESIRDGVIAIDGQAMVTLTNEAAGRLLGWQQSGDLPLPLSHAGLPRQLCDLLLEAKDGRAREMALPGDDGGELLVRAYPLNGEDGAAGAVAVIVDMAEAERLRRLRENIVADLAHELRGPMNNLKLLVDALVDGTARGKARLRYVGAIEEEMQHLVRLSEDVLDLARMDAGVLQLKAEPVRLRELAVAVGESLAVKAREDGVSLEVRVPDGVEVLAAPSRLRQVLFNLADNAVCFTPRGGTVTIAAACAEGRAQITVSDTGVGIDHRHLPHVFDRFYKVDPARSRARPGAGLGLAVAKNLVELQGGTISLQSEVGRGSVFTVTLPAVCSKGGSAEPLA